MIPYQIISTGSKGNAVIINKTVLIDCGIPFRDLKPYIKNIKLVLLTHIHSDHFKVSTIKKLHQERPTIRFACGKWMVVPLYKAGIPTSVIDVLSSGLRYTYSICSVSPVDLVHDVPNYGWKITFATGKVFYATDTGNLNGISARHYDLYLIEANYTDEELKERMDTKRAAGVFAYEPRVLQNHLSKAQCDNWILKNMGSWSEIAYLHCHEE